jgi:hypothetical protein
VGRCCCLQRRTNRALPGPARPCLARTPQPGPPPWPLPATLRRPPARPPRRPPCPPPHPPTDALALAGCDYLILSPKLLASLAATPTSQGYNDGLTASSDDSGDGIDRQLSPAMAAESAAPKYPEVGCPPGAGAAWSCGSWPRARWCREPGGRRRARWPRAPACTLPPPTAAPPAQVTQQLFEEQLGLAGSQLLKSALEGLVADFESIVPYFRRASFGTD